MNGPSDDLPDAPAPTPALGGPRPTGRDQEAWARFASDAPARLANAVRVWRNGYVLLLTGLGALAVAAASLLADQEAALVWRVVLTSLLGAAMACAGGALWMSMSSEVRMKTDLVGLREIVDSHLSFEQYLVDEAGIGMLRLRRSHWWAGLAAVLGLAASLCLFWVGA